MTDGRTDGQTDRQTDRKSITIACVTASQWHAKNLSSLEETFTLLTHFLLLPIEIRCKYQTIYIYYITGMTERKKGSGRPRSACTEENVSSVEELPLSQEGQSQTHRSMRQISIEIGIHQSSVFRIIHDDLGLKSLEQVLRRVALRK